MKRAVIVVILGLLFAGAPYVRREWRPAGASTYLVTGSRDRTLHGKQRRNARKANHG